MKENRWVGIVAMDNGKTKNVKCYTFQVTEY